MRIRKCHPTIDELMHSAAVDTLALAFATCHYFDGTLTYVDESGNTVNYPDLDFKPSDLFLYWATEYAQLKSGFGFFPKYSYTDSELETQYIALATKIRLKAEDFIKINKHKFLQMVKTYGLQYDPINNYDMVEVSGDAKKVAKGEQKNSITGGIVTDTDAPETQTQVYSSTYDDASNDRLASRQTQEYLDTYRVDGTVPIKRTVQRAENEGDGSTTTTEYKDTQTLTWDDITTPSAHEVGAKKRIRKGNIGVTTTQEMIEAERELARQNIIKEFFDELNKHITLCSWQWYD